MIISHNDILIYMLRNETLKLVIHAMCETDVAIENGSKLPLHLYLMSRLFAKGQLKRCNNNQKLQFYN